MAENVPQKIERRGGPRFKTRADDRRGWNARGYRDGSLAVDSYVPNEAHREMVKTYAVLLTLPDLASFIGISYDTIVKYYRPEIDIAVARANAQVAGKLYQQALAGNLTAIIWWEKSRAGRSERLELGGPGGGPIELRDLSGLDDDQLDAALRGIEQAVAALAALGQGEPEGGA